MIIIHLAQENQKLYNIEALYHYRHSNKPEPRFMDLHGILARPVRNLFSNRARQLNDFPELTKQIGTVQNENIFGYMNACAVWEKVRRHNINFSIINARIQQELFPSEPYQQSALKRTQDEIG